MPLVGLLFWDDSHKHHPICFWPNLAFGSSVMWKNFLERVFSDSPQPCLDFGICIFFSHRGRFWHGSGVGWFCYIFYRWSRDYSQYNEFPSHGVWQKTWCDAKVCSLSLSNPPPQKLQFVPTKVLHKRLRVPDVLFFRLTEEIDEKIGDKRHICYEDAMNLEYAGMVIKVQS